MSSISFDRAAGIYDATRALPDDVAQALTDALIRELSAVGATRALEVGIGTGRIARPLAERGVRVTGVDIAPKMLARLRDQLGPEHAPPDLVLGDATRLPFADETFAAVIIVHVLHLVSSPADTLAELRRVLGQGGVFLHPTTDYPGENPFAVAYQKSNDLLRELGVVRRKRVERGEIHDMLRGLGASLRTETLTEVKEDQTPALSLERTRDRVDSWSWEVPESVFAEFYARYEQWNREHFGDLERVFVQRVVYGLEVWRFG
jgi:ubiquinone/menaquinone biosynthesis C-methylase UbiE